MSAGLQVQVGAECPSCGAAAVPEQDGECQWLACLSCEYEFAWQLVKHTQGACSLGVPATIRSQFQAPPPQPGKVFLGQIGLRRND